MKTKTLPLVLVIASLAGCGSGDAIAPNLQAAQLSTGILVDTEGATGDFLLGTAFADPALAADSGQFTINMYQDSLGTIALAQVALQRATDERVRRFAQQVLADHDRFNSSINTLAPTKGIPLPTTLTAQQVADVERLNGLVPDALNIVYMSLNVATLDADAAAAMLQALRGGDADVRLLASTALPKLELHHAVAVEIENQLNPPVFLVSLHSGNMFEIMSAQLALQKSSNESVRQFAQQMINEHTAAEGQVAAMAPNKGITLPPDLPPSKRAALDYLASFNGTDFDKAFMDKQAVAHTLTMRKVRDMAERSHDPDVKALATQLQPTIDAHLAMAQQVNGQLMPSYLYGAAQDANTMLRLAQLTADMGTNTNLLAFARQLTPDIAGGLPTITSLAQQRNQALPVAPSLDELTAFATLMQTSGNDFDVQLVGQLQTAIGRILSREQMQAQDNNDMGLYDYANANVAQTMQRQTNIEQIRQQLGGAVPQ